MQSTEVFGVGLQQLEPLVGEQALPGAFEAGLCFVQLLKDLVNGPLLSPGKVGLEVGLHCFDRVGSTLSDGAATLCRMLSMRDIVPAAEPRWRRRRDGLGGSLRSRVIGWDSDALWWGALRYRAVPSLS